MFGSGARLVEGWWFFGVSRFINPAARTAVVVIQFRQRNKNVQLEPVHLHGVIFVK
jgi:hypothetical protein